MPICSRQRLSMRCRSPASSTDGSARRDSYISLYICRVMLATLSNAKRSIAVSDLWEQSASYAQLTDVTP